MFSSPFHRLSALVIALWLAGGAGYGAEPSDPWEVLSELRDHLAAETRQADFVQTYHPAGFETGDRETGRLYLALPECVRWEYEEPFPKSFVLCEDTIFTWNPGEQAGRRFLLTDSDEPGIDLLRLQPDDLRQRYDAQLENLEGGELEVVLTPRTEGASIQQARLGVDSQRQTLSSLTYQDLEGNVSRFDISGYEPLDDPSLFSPPADMEWLDQ